MRTTDLSKVDFTKFHADLLPDHNGYYGRFGGCYLPEDLTRIMQELDREYKKAVADPAFMHELHELYKHYAGRPTPVYPAKNLTRLAGRAQIYLKREDLNFTGAHKLNHCLGEALLAKRLGKTKIIAETGAGQHGVALATAAALTGLQCDIYMGEVDIAKEHPNVLRMRILGTNVIPVSHGLKSLKEAVDACFEAYLKDPVTQLYAIGSAVGPHPFPMMVRDFQSVISKESKEQMLEMTGRLPDHVVACVGGGSNAAGSFAYYLSEPRVQLWGVEPLGKGTAAGEHAASITYGEEGVMHGFNSIMLKDSEGNPAPVYSVASGLDYPSVGPLHAYLKETGRVNYSVITDEEAIEAFMTLSRIEGIIPAIESSHAVAFALKLARELPATENILLTLSGRGDKDIDFVTARYGEKYGLTE